MTYPDAIQFLTAGSVVTSSDIRITDNVIYRGSGNATVPSRCQIEAAASSIIFSSM